MSPEEMRRFFERHRDAEAARDYDAILATFVDDCFLETHPLGLRSEGRAAARAAYEGYFTAFPDLNPDDEGQAFGDYAHLFDGAEHAERASAALTASFGSILEARGGEQGQSPVPRAEAKVALLSRTAASGE